MFSNWPLQLWLEGRYARRIKEWFSTLNNSIAREAQTYFRSSLREKRWPEIHLRFAGYIKHDQEYYTVTTLTLVVEFGGRLSLEIFAMILCFRSY